MIRIALAPGTRIAHWVADFHYVRCGHPESMDCRCYGKAHMGELAVDEVSE